jgi:hypothetical protein
MGSDLKPAAGLLGMAAGLALAASAHAATPGVYYESFAGVELASISLASPTSAFGFHSGNATNISPAGPDVYWQDGVNIYKSSLDLKTTTLFHSNGVAPTDFAVDTKHDIYYESFAGVELAAIRLDAPTSAVNFLNVNASNISLGGDYVYWQDGVNIYRANPDLTGVTLFHSNGVAPTDFAIDPAHDIYYESFAGIELAAIHLDAPTSAVNFLDVNASNISVAGDFVYWQDGVNIWRANPDLTGAALFHSNGVAPTDFAVQAAVADIPIPARGVPEPATWALMLAGFGLAGAALRRARPARA